MYENPNFNLSHTCAIPQMHLPIVAAAVCAVAGSGLDVKVNQNTSMFNDLDGRSLMWHGTNFVNKGAPFYPEITGQDITTMKELGMSVVRLGVMIDGVFPVGAQGEKPVINATYLETIESIVSNLWSNGIASILDLHQDVLGSRICGEGTASWMLNSSLLHSLPFPEPLTGLFANHSKPDPATGGWTPPIDCHTVGPLKSIGWSEFYMTDACGKAFQQMYDLDPAKGPLGSVFALHWEAVASKMAHHPGVLAYELLNEPWVGDHLGEPALLLEAGVAEKRNLEPFFTALVAKIRSVDPDTMVLYAPAEVNNRAMRRVGYEVNADALQTQHHPPSHHPCAVARSKVPNTTAGSALNNIHACVRHAPPGWLASRPADGVSCVLRGGHRRPRPCGATAERAVPLQRQGMATQRHTVAGSLHHSPLSACSTLAISPLAV